MVFKSVLLSLSIIMSSPIFADGGGSGSNNEYSHLPSEFDKAVESIESENYTLAIQQLETLNQPLQNDADVLNLLGYSHRKLKDFNIAEDYYLSALDIKDDHRGANEYLGELYLETDRLEKAQERLKVLRVCSQRSRVAPV